VGHGLLATRLCVAALAAAGAAVSLSGSAAAQAMALAAIAAPVAACALVVSQTRNAWIGAVIGLSVVALLRAPRLLWLLGLATAAVLVLRPAAITSVSPSATRAPATATTCGRRVSTWCSTSRSSAGPGMILVAYPRYRWPEATHPMQPHLHNNLLQIAAERGLPGLAFFLWWAVAVFAAAIGEARRGVAEARAPDWAAGGALAALAAVFVAGLSNTISATPRS